MYINIILVYKYFCIFDFQSNGGTLIFNIFIINIVLVGVVYFLFLLIYYKRIIEIERISSYECGFNPRVSTRLEFSYRFFLISILFIIFDVEIALLLPVPFVSGRIIILWLFIVFIIILVCGLLYESIWGSLDWLN